MYLNQNEDTNLQMVSPRQLRGKNINHKIPLSNFYLTYTIQNSDISHHSLKHHNRRACRQEKLDNQFLETQTQGTPHIHTKIFTGKLNEKNIKPPPPKLDYIPGSSNVVRNFYNSEYAQCLPLGGESWCHSFNLDSDLAVHFKKVLI